MANVVVLSDLSIRNSELDTEKFRSLIWDGKPVGYEPWKNFINGDYTYQDIKYRITLQSQNLQDRLSINKLVLSVDVNDRFENGTETILNANDGVDVVFAKPFHQPPHVDIAWRSGTQIGTAYVDNASLTETGFTAYIENSVSKQLGTITWSARGY